MNGKQITSGVVLSLSGILLSACLGYLLHKRKPVPYCRKKLLLSEAQLVSVVENGHMTNAMFVLKAFLDRQNNWNSGFNLFWGNKRLFTKSRSRKNMQSAFIFNNVQFGTSQ